MSFKQKVAAFLFADKIEDSNAYQLRWYNEMVQEMETADVNSRTSAPEIRAWLLRQPDKLLKDIKYSENERLPYEAAEPYLFRMAAKRGIANLEFHNVIRIREKVAQEV